MKRLLLYIVWLTTFCSPLLADQGLGSMVFDNGGLELTRTEGNTALGYTLEDFTYLYVRDSSFLLNTFTNTTANLAPVAVGSIGDSYVLGFSAMSSTAISPDFYFKTNYETGIRANNYLVLGTTAVGDLMTFTGDNKIGVGTTTPEAVLDVEGKLAVDGPIGAYLWNEASDTDDSGDVQYNIAFDFITNAAKNNNLADDASLGVYLVKDAGTSDWNDVFYDLCTNASYSEGGCTNSIDKYRVQFVSGNTTGTAKTFIIDHPTDADRYLIHASIESPENAVFYRGTATLSQGKAVIKLPSYVPGFTDPYSASFQIQNLSGFDVIYVKEGLQNNTFTVLSDSLDSTAQFSWEVTLTRTDVEPLWVEPAKDTITVYGKGPYTYFRKNK